jgi:serine/threonine-protein kinase
MAPEQLDAKRVDHRADLFSMGVVAYQCLTGSLPVTLSAMLWQGFPSTHEAMLTVRNHAPHVSEAVEAVVMRALAHDPGRRFESANAMASAFESAMIAPRNRPCSDKTTRNLPVGDKDWAS